MPPLPFSTQFPPSLPMNSYLIIVVTPQKMWYNVRHPFAYVGMAWAMDLMITSFLPMLNKFSFRPLTLWTILSIRCRKQSLMSAPTNAGKPQYLSIRDSLMIFKDRHTSNFTSVFVFLDKKILWLVRTIRKYLTCSYSTIALSLIKKKTIGLSFDNNLSNRFLKQSSFL